MDKFTKRPVRLKVDVAGFDLTRSIKQHQKRLAEKRQQRLQKTTQQDALSFSGTQQVAVANAEAGPIVFGEGTSTKEPNQASQSTEFHMDL